MLPKPPECYSAPGYPSPCVLTRDALYNVAKANPHRAAKGFSNEFGTGALGLYIMGEANGDNEASEGRPFIESAPAGSMLESLLRRCGVDRQQVRMGNIVSCQPPNDKLTGTGWEFDAIERCRCHWERRLEAARPKVILALGNVALRALTGHAGKMRGITALRGYVFETKYGLVIPTLHPAFIRRGKTGFMGLFMFDLMRAVNICRHGYDRPQLPKYDTFPGLDMAESFLRQVQDNPSQLVTYDCETRESFGGEEDELEFEHMDEEELDQAAAWEGRGDALSKLGTTITQIQFSLAPETGIVFPADPAYMEISRKIMATGNPKAGQNCYRFDNPIFRGKYGWEINGLNHDSRWAWHHIQPDLPANLQLIASVYDFPFPWKHMADSDPGLYGGCDVDAPQRIMAKILTHMEKRGVLKGYMDHIVRFDPVLVNMSRRGILQDQVEKEKFRGELHGLIREVDGVIQAAAPESIRKLHPTQGYKSDKDAEKQGAKENGPATHAQFHGVWVRAKVNIGDALTENWVERWAKRMNFNPNSSPQLIEYMRSKGHKIPWNRKEARDTTEKKELERLAKSTGDAFYLSVLDIRGYRKMLSTYVEGWKAAADGRIHSEFGYGPATGQLSSRGPNVQNAPKHRKPNEVEGDTLADKFRRTIIARPGHRLVELDFKSFHAQTLARNSSDPTYLRMARIDMHSFFTAGGVLALEKPEKLMSMSDEELKDFFNWHKTCDKLYDGKTFKWIRDKLAKPCILGYGFGMGGYTLYDQNKEYMPSAKYADGLIKRLDGIFPITAKWRQNICRDVHNGTNVTGSAGWGKNLLVSPHGYLRWFWEVMRWDSRRRIEVSGDDHEKAIAFLPANDAFGHYRCALNRLEDRGVNETGRYINNLHDAGLYEIPDPEGSDGSEFEGIVREIKGEMEKPSEVLFHKELCPGGFQVDVDVQVSARGGYWAKKVKMKDGTVVNPLGMEDWKV